MYCHNLIIYITNGIIHIAGDTMENIIYDNEVYRRLYKFDNTIIKYSVQNINAWKKLMAKNISFINTPIDCAQLSTIEKRQYVTCDSKIKLPYLDNYYTLYKLPFIKQHTKKDILLLMKEILQCVKVMHTKNIYHGDLYSKNIMINEKLDISFIDFDAAIIDDIVSEENVYYLDDISTKEIIKNTANDDKKSIFMLLCYYLVNNNFNVDISYKIDIDNLILPKYLLSEIKNYIENKNPEDNYYYIDIIDELISYECKNKINVKKK